jgi:hypothetical protein
MYELLVLLQAETPDGIARERSRDDPWLDRRALTGYTATLVEAGLLVGEGQGSTFRLTEAGRRRLRSLMVDYVRELRNLTDGANDMLRRSLVALALEGVVRVAFFPFSETADVAAGVLPSLGLELVAVVDDDPARWGMRFHGLRVQSPDVLRDVQLDGIIITTAVFQDPIMRRIRELGLGDVRVHVF